jgi:hypothetical protein
MIANWNKIGDGALADFSVFTPGFAEQVGGSGVAIWDFIDIHGHNIITITK